jgi:hypothetical protein
MLLPEGDLTQMGYVVNDNSPFRQTLLMGVEADMGRRAILQVVGLRQSRGREDRAG